MMVTEETTSISVCDDQSSSKAVFTEGEAPPRAPLVKFGRPGRWLTVRFTVRPLSIPITISAVLFQFILLSEVTVTSSTSLPL